eukprot:7541288-Alexandrium_andersonii.AAC.1
MLAEGLRAPPANRGFGMQLRELRFERPRVHAHWGVGRRRLSQGAVLLEPEPALGEEEPLL